MTALLIATSYSICRLGAIGAVLSLALLFMIGLAEILARGLFGFSLSFHQEYAGYLTALSLIWGAGYALLKGAHVRLSLVDELLSKNTQIKLSQLANVIGFVISLMLTIALVKWSITSYMDGEVSFFAAATPLWIPQAFMAFGPLTLMAAFFIRLQNPSLETSKGESL